MSTNQTPILSAELTNDRISMPYPHIEILEPTDAVALVLPSLSKGDLPVLCTLKGSTRKLTSIRKSALVISDLLSVTALKFHKDANVVVELNSIEDIMEVLV